jgi:predicted transcriptional regulator of viral defense system
VSDAADALGVDRGEAARRLAALASAGWLRRVRRGLYLAVPVDAPDPRAWTEDEWYLADLVWHPCYITGWSAANFWSLTDQVFRSTVVATTARVRKVEQELAGNRYLVHHVNPDRLSWGLEPEWRHDRRVLVANRARTVADMLDRPGLGGGIRHVAEILDTYLVEASPADLVDAVERLGNGAAFKRLGYLIETLGLDAPGVVDACADRVTSGMSLLDPDLPRTGRRSPRWGLVANAEFDR